MYFSFMSLGWKHPKDIKLLGFNLCFLSLMRDLEKECPETGDMSSPDVDAAQQSEEQPQCEGHGNSQQGGQQPVEEELDQLEGGVAPDPNSVEAVGGAGLANHIFKTHLLRNHNQSRPKS